MYCSWCVTSSNFPAALHSFFVFWPKQQQQFSHKIRAKQSSECCINLSLVFYVYRVDRVTWELLLLTNPRVKRNNEVKKRQPSLLIQPLDCSSLTNLPSQFAVLIDVSYLLAAEVSGGLSAGTAVHGSFRVAAVVVTVACGRFTLIHGVVLGRPL